MGLLVDDESAAEMRRLIELVEAYNLTELGQKSPYEVVGVGADADGTMTLKLRKKTP